MSEEGKWNPYAAPQDFVPLPSDVDKPNWYRRQTYLFRSVICWTLVCMISAAPSFFWGITSIAQYQALAMLLGIMTFIVAYIAADVQTKNTAFRNNRLLSTVLWCVYVFRIGISVLFPIALYLDLAAGIVSVAIYEALSGKAIISSTYAATGDFRSFVDVYLITIFQGVVLNAVLVVVAIPIAVVVLVVQSFRSR